MNFLLFIYMYEIYIVPLSLTDNINANNYFQKPTKKKTSFKTLLNLKIRFRNLFKNV